MGNKTITVWLILLTAWVGLDYISQDQNRQERNSQTLIRNKRFENIEAKVKSIEQVVKLSPVDFSESNAQQLGNGFMLANAAQEKHLTGIKFTGRIINTQSVHHENAIFDFSVDGKNKEFTINKISPGNIAIFDVYIPDLKLENARYAQIKYFRSKILFYAKSRTQ